ncbi:hypothetical protein [Isachenkonia alkalipeptolytica]|uniref:Uncharacterized protein n=1 Tax=Isachenkonia alkalipeptolytica TaxID=2565777 RepID=A0AA43XM75_9CLOT|nr:hypothetical protein [Isachenkonia alkalipeptolytica]NBG88924.1 hypothetical protein [Isachenkonia alkalipeptolytica]
MGKFEMGRCITSIEAVLSEKEAKQSLLTSDIFEKQENLKIMEYCIDKFIKAEMELQSSSVRGVGRLTDQIPRFGGVYRKQILHFYKEEIAELEELFKELIYIGYFTHITLYEQFLKTPVCKDQYKLYQMWIMYILGINPQNYPQGIRTIEKASKKTRDYIKKQMDKLEINLSKDEEEVLDKILLFYGFTGFSLRRGEMGFKF